MNLKNISFVFLFLFVSSNAFAAKAYFAGGCFWCMESDFEKIKGVSEAISGFTGGTLKDPTYRGNHSGHYEAVEVIYDPKVVSYKELLDHFWKSIDPFDAKGQFCDKGFSYLSALFPSSEEEIKLAMESRKKVVARFPKQKVVTPVLKAAIFYPIKGSEEGHQNYYKKNPIRYKAYRWNCGRDKRLEQIWGPRK
jgi:peptide-methionine (S)-S-oxide reductase